jgi:TetR/AcrR family transcriptional repressor of nem operon
MRYDADHKARTRAKLLQEAARAIRAEGPANVGVAGIMARAGLTHGGFYAHFASRDDLLTQAVGESFRDGAGLFARTTGTAAPRQALANYIRSYLSRTHRDMPATGCPLPALASELPRLSEETREQFAAGLASLTGKLAGLMEAAGMPEPLSLAASVLAEAVGALALARAVPDPDQSAAVLRNSRRALLRRLDLEDVPQ